MKLFNRKYFCQDAREDTMDVAPLDGDRVRITCSSDVSVASVHLNKTQVDNLVALLIEWHTDVPVDGPLWEDKCDEGVQ